MRDACSKRTSATACCLQALAARAFVRRREVEVRRHGVLEAGLRAAAVLTAGRRPDGRPPDVEAAAPVAADVAERREAGLAAVRRHAGAVDPGAADDGDAPAGVG